MRYCFFMLILAAVAAAGVGCGEIKPKQEPTASVEPSGSEKPGASQGAIAHEEPPLLLEDEPLLLANDGSEVAPPAGPVADNSRCYVCHINYMQEDLAVIHARANIGCADCHGDSDAHIADESWASGGNGTPPDVMYRKAEINPFCTGCHPRDKIDAEQHQPFFAGTAREKYCTDCHGAHRLAHRKCKWK